MAACNAEPFLRMVAVCIYTKVLFDKNTIEISRLLPLWHSRLRKSIERSSSLCSRILQTKRGDRQCHYAGLLVLHLGILVYRKQYEDARTHEHSAVYACVHVLLACSRVVLRGTSVPRGGARINAIVSLSIRASDLLALGLLRRLQFEREVDRGVSLDEQARGYDVDARHSELGHVLGGDASRGLDHHARKLGLQLLRRL